jgi:uncharacterized protein with gpF-like domain
MWQDIEAAKDTHPYVRYITRRDGNVRSEHAAWDNVTLPVDDPFWDAHNPPCGYRCRCRVTTLRQAEYDRRKGEGSIKTAAPPERMVETVDRKSGKTFRAPAGVHPAFAYNPGKAAMRNAAQAQMVGAKIAAAPAALGAAAGKELDALGSKLDATFAGWVDEVRQVGMARHASAVYGVMRPEELAAYARITGILPASAAILMEDRLIVGRKAARHQTAGDALTDEELKALPALMRGERKAYLQLDNGNVIYLLPSKEKATKLAVAVNFVRGKGVMNMTRSAFRIDPKKVTDAPKEYEELK